MNVLMVVLAGFIIKLWECWNKCWCFEWSNSWVLKSLNDWFFVIMLVWFISRSCLGMWARIFWEWSYVLSWNVRRQCCKVTLMIQEEFPKSIVVGGLLLCVGMFLGLLWGVAWYLRVGPYNWYKIVPALVELPSK